MDRTIGNLVIGRKVGQDTFVGDNITIRLMSYNDYCAELLITIVDHGVKKRGIEHCVYGSSIAITPDVQLTIVEQRGNTTVFKVTAPKCIPIRRKEAIKH